MARPAERVRTSETAHPANSPVPIRHSFGPVRRGADVTETEIEAILHEFVTTRDAALREWLVRMHEPMVRQLAGRFRSDRLPREDLLQVGYVGLIKALDRFDPGRGSTFVAYAIPTILGEIKRYFRDQTWTVKVPRRLCELGLTLRQVRSELEQQLGRSPTIPELAAAATVSEERLVEALEAEYAYNPCSLDTGLEAHEGEVRWGTLGAEDPAFQRLEEEDALYQALSCLEPREQRIIFLRYFEELTQVDVAGRLGISQMHVSRLERRALRQLRKLLAG